MEVSELARDKGVYDEVHNNLFKAYFLAGKNIGDQEVLFDIAEDAGLERGEVKAALEDRRHNESSHPVESFAAFDHSESQSDDELVAHETTQEGEATQRHNEQSHPAALTEPTIEFGSLHDEEFDALNEETSQTLNAVSSPVGDSSQEATLETSDHEIEDTYSPELFPGNTPE